MAWDLKDALNPHGATVPCPPHLEVGTLVHDRKQEEGRFIRCTICDVASNSRRRRGDAEFLRAHK